MLLEWIDVAEGHRAPEPKKRWPGKDCRWLTNDRVLVQREPNGIHTVLEVVDSATGATIGRRIRIPNWDLRNSFKDLSPDGRFLLLENGQKSLLLWSLGAGTPPPGRGDE